MKTNIDIKCSYGTLQRRILLLQGFLSAGVNHEFKNILSRIKIYVDYGLIPGNHETKSCLHGIEEQLVPDSLSFLSLLSSPENYTQYNPEPLLLPDGFKDFIKILKASCKSYNITLVESIAVPVQIFADKRDIITILSDMLFCICFFSEIKTDEKVIDIRVEAQNKKVRIIVSDSGMNTGIISCKSGEEKGLRENNEGMLFCKTIAERNNGNISQWTKSRKSGFLFVIPLYNKNESGKIKGDNGL